MARLLACYILLAVPVHVRLSNMVLRPCTPAHVPINIARTWAGYVAVIHCPVLYASALLSACVFSRFFVMCLAVLFIIHVQSYHSQSKPVFLGTLSGFNHIPVWGFGTDNLYLSVLIIPALGFAAGYRGRGEGLVVCSNGGRGAGPGGGGL